jgi:HK97 family phage major capsid protein
MSKTLRDELAEAKAKAAAVFTTAEKEQRELTDEERASVQAHLDEAKAIKAKIDRASGDAEMRAQIEALTGGTQALAVQSSQPARGRLLSMGQQFVQSEAGQWLKKSRNRRGVYQSPAADVVEGFGPYATTITGETTSAGDLLVPEYRPGIIPLLFRRIMVTDLIASGTTDATSIKTMVETTFTNAAASVAAGGTKPESTLVFDLRTDNVEKIAHWIPVHDEMLDDVSGLASYIDARLRLGLDLTEEDLLLNGDGTSPNISGILDRTGLATPLAYGGADTNSADTIFRQMMAIMTDAFVLPDAIVMHPTEWQTTVLRQDGNGHYFAGGPFNSPPTPMLWGLPVAVTPVIADGTALVGAFRSAAIFFRKSGTTVSASNSHSDYFVKNMTAIRAERRGALAVLRPSAFGLATGLS